MKNPHVLMPKSHVGECDEHWRSVVVDAKDTVCVWFSFFFPPED